MGPLVLARSKKLGTSEEAMFFFDSIHGKGAAAKVQAVTGKKANVLCQFDVTLTENETHRLLKCATMARRLTIFLTSTRNSSTCIYKKKAVLAKL